MLTNSLQFFLQYLTLVRSLFAYHLKLPTTLYALQFNRWPFRIVLKYNNYDTPLI